MSLLFVEQYYGKSKIDLTNSCPIYMNQELVKYFEISIYL